MFLFLLQRVPAYPAVFSYLSCSVLLFVQWCSCGVPVCPVMRVQGGIWMHCSVVRVTCFDQIISAFNDY